MLNNKLRVTDLINDLEGFVTEIDLITDDIMGIKKIPFTNDQEMLGKIHHALHIADYKKSNFRYNLLLRGDKGKLIEFFQKTNLIPETQATLSSSELISLCEKSSKFQWGNNMETELFVNIFGYESSLIPLTKEKKEEIEHIETAKRDKKTGEISLKLYSKQPFRQLYPYQSEIFYNANEIIDIKHTRFIIQMPTGSGKTRTAMEITSHFLNRGVENERQIIWLADKEELLEQAIESFKNVYPHLGNKSVKIYRVWGDYEPLKIEKNSMIFAGYEKLKNLLKQNKQFVMPDLIICDEAHNVISPTYKSLIEDLTDKGARVIGLTATPVRGISTSENDDLKEFFYNEIIDITPKNSENTITYLQKKGYLSHVHKFDIDTGSKISIPLDILRSASKSRDLPEKFLELLAKKHERNSQIAKELRNIGKMKKRTLYFGTNIYQSKLICAILILSNISAVHIDGKTPIDYRRDVIKKFRDGKIDIICNCDVFTTGFDEPKLEVVMIGRPTKSIVLHQQMIGRGMRGPKMGGTKKFNLYRINDNLPSIELADHYFTDFWSS